MKIVQPAPAQLNERIYKWPQRVCVQCGDSFRARDHLKCQKCRNPIKDRICIQCGKSFRARGSLRCIKCSQPSKDRICIQCGDSFRSRSELKCGKCRRPIKARICIQCGDSFRSRSNLKCSQCNGHKAKRRALKLNQECGCITQLPAINLFVCIYCNNLAEHWDHIFPLSKGGLHCWNNLVPACQSCNSRKGTKTIQELGWTFTYEPDLPHCTNTA